MEQNQQNQQIQQMQQILNDFMGSTLSSKNMEIGVQTEKGKKKTIIEYQLTEKEANKIVKIFRKKFSCGGYTKKDENGFWVAILNGDHRIIIKKEFLENPIFSDLNFTESNILIHGG